MKTLRVMMMVFAVLSASYALETYARTETPTVILNKHLAKLLGTWTSAGGDVTFNSNGTIVYKGRKSYCAIAQGTIQISKKKVTQILPYRYLDGKLLITDSGEETTYTHVFEP